MRIGYSWILAAWIFVAAPVLAQTPRPTESPASPPISETIAVPSMQASTPDTFGFWVRADYLAYWVKSAPVPVSIVTGASANPTQELLNTNQNLGMLSGFRIGIGGWFDAESSVGLDANFFSFQQRTRTFAASSDSTGSPILAFPFINQTPGAVGWTMLPISMPGLFTGNVQAASSIKLWGTEANGTFALFRQSGLEVVALAGVRYLDLQERLNLSTLSTDIVTDPVTVLFQNDQFGTRNQFYGAQLGGRVNWQGERFGFDITGKVALGGTHQSIDINGYSTQTGPGGVNGTFPGGFFTQGSNTGRYTSNQFTFVPTVEMKLYALITANLRAFVGYDFIYWSSVVRPGGQIDRNINLSQSTIFGSGVLSGPASPMPMFTRTDFWAQGITLGLELRF